MSQQMPDGFWAIGRYTFKIYKQSRGVSERSQGHLRVGMRDVECLWGLTDDDQLRRRRVRLGKLRRSPSTELCVGGEPASGRAGSGPRLRFASDETKLFPPRRAQY